MRRASRTRPSRASEAKEVRATTLPLPEYFAARGMLRDNRWVEAYISTVLQWPKTCTLSSQDRQLVGLAKALAFSWEPGILNHTDLALRSGSSPEVVSEVLRAASVTIGLAQLDRTIRTLPAGRLDRQARGDLKPVRDYFGVIPPLFKRAIVLGDRRWLERFITVSMPAYNQGQDLIRPRLRALVCLAAAAVAGWGDGIRLYGLAARRFGATGDEVSDVTKSVFKTAVSNAMALGFRTPCHIPRLEKYRTILSAYVETGALAKRTSDALETSQR